MAALSRVLILDPGMTRSFGHHYGYNHAFGAAFRRERLEVRSYFSGGLPQELADEFPDSSACFNWSLFEEMIRVGDNPDDFYTSAQAFCSELQSYASPAAGPDALVFAHTLDPTALLGISLWYRTIRESDRPALALNIMLGVSDTRECHRQLEAGCTLLRGMPRVRLFGGTRAIGEILSALMGQTCQMLPTPLPEQPEQYYANSQTEKLVFGLTGDWRPEKNLHIIPSALALYLKKGGHGHFTIQMTPTDESIHPVVLTLHDLSLLHSGKITLDIRYLEEKAYYANLASFSALLLPYRASEYPRYRPSGLAIEAAALAVPVIGAGGGFIEEELAQLGNGSLFVEMPTREYLVDGLFRFEREWETRKKRALAAAPGYASHHDIQRWAKTMISLA